MPTYEYECLECKNRFEKFQSMSDKPLTACVACGGEVRKVFGAGAGIIFKGSGFYVNDSKGSCAAKKSGSEKKESSEKPEACSSCGANGSCNA
jgi:putative FmdB family regulatory protein